MADPIATLAEGLLSPGTIRLFGRPFTGLAVGDLGVSLSRQNPLAAALKAATDAKEGVSLARVYAFTYLGNYFKLAEPLVFLVFGAGEPVPSGTADVEAGQLGVETHNVPFAAGIRVWAVDQLDMAVRIEIRVGWMKDLLLSEMSGDSNMTGGGEVRRADLVGRDANLVGRDANLVGRDANLIGRDANLVGRGR